MHKSTSNSLIFHASAPFNSVPLKMSMGFKIFSCMHRAYHQFYSEVPCAVVIAAVDTNISSPMASQNTADQQLHLVHAVSKNT